MDYVNLVAVVIIPAETIEIIEPTAPEPTVSAPVQQPPVTVALAIGKTPNQFLINMSLGVAVSGTTSMTILAVMERRRRNAIERGKEDESTDT